MTGIESELIERLKKLPPHRVAEVVDFVDFLAARERAAQRFADTLDLPPICADAMFDTVPPRPR